MVLMKKLITIVIPAYNEEKSLPSLFERLENLTSANRGYNFEFLFVNDGSKDKTLSILQHESSVNPHISYLNFSRNFGKEIAVAAGIDHADGDAVVIMDADGQEPPELVPDMIKWWEQGYDDVYARRTGRRNVSWFTRFTSWGYYRVMQSLTRIPIQIDTGDFRLFSRRAILALRQFPETGRQNKALFSWIGYKKKDIEFIQQKRVAGQTHWSFWKRLNLAIDGITSFTIAPLRLVTFVGVIIALVTFFYIVVVVVQHLLGVPRVEGFSTLLVVTLFLGGIQLIGLGIIGEYIGRIFNETKHRPLYLIEEFHKAKVVGSGKKDEPEKPADQ
jgi:glycosyltransferase involved in cell wall biosynthesis